MSIDFDTSTTDGAAMRASVGSVLDQIAKNADRAERERKVPVENIEALRDAGFFKSLQPAKFGGTPMGAEEYAPAVVAIAQSCAATAWASGLLAQHSHMIALMSSYRMRSGATIQTHSCLLRLQRSMDAPKLWVG